MLCVKCKKRTAVVFVSRMDGNNKPVNEGYCLKCARGLGIPQIDQAVKQMGISEEDLDLLSDEMSNMALVGKNWIPKPPPLYRRSSVRCLVRRPILWKDLPKTETARKRKKRKSVRCWINMV